MTAELLERPSTELRPMNGIPVPALGMRHVSVTGTRMHMPQWQQAAWGELVFAFKPVTNFRYHPLSHVEMHHGCCTGADTEAHWLAANYGYDVSLHPATGVDDWQNTTLQPIGSGICYSPKRTKDRNECIVGMADVLLAAPAWPEDHPRSKRSGTWQTIRMARQEAVPIYYAMNDGKLYVEGK